MILLFISLLTHRVRFLHFQNTVLKELQSYDLTDPEAAQAYRELNDERTLKLLPSSFTAEQAFTVIIIYLLSTNVVDLIDHYYWIFIIICFWPSYTCM